jgi:16S rRNA (adenine1518-N6/adenine1519-N6)-dimethyltransferase
MRAKKSLGQHFLSSPHYLNAIAEAGGVAEGDLVLEVGPGKGTLTAELLSRGARVVAVEKDDRLIAPLRERFASEAKQRRFTLVHGDILEADLAKLTAKKPYKVVANVPYYISGALIRLFLEAKHQPAHMALLLQKEVVERIAREKKEGLLSLSVKAYGTPLYIKKVPAGAFSPPPKVDSAILAVSNISRRNFKSASHEKRFFALIHAGFAHKRKALGKALTPLVGERAAGIARMRAEDVPLTVWLALSR